MRNIWIFRSPFKLVFLRVKLCSIKGVILSLGNNCLLESLKKQLLVTSIVDMNSTPSESSFVDRIFQNLSNSNLQDSFVSKKTYSLSFRLEALSWKTSSQKGKIKVFHKNASMTVPSEVFWGQTPMMEICCDWHRSQVRNNFTICLK